MFRPRRVHCLAAEATFRTDLARYTGDLGRERTQLLDHRIQRFLELQNFAAYVDSDLRERSPLAIAVATSAILRTWRGEVPRHEVHRFRQILPCPATPGTTAWPPSLPSVPTSRATRVTSPANAFS